MNPKKIYNSFFLSSSNGSNFLAQNQKLKLYLTKQVFTDGLPCKTSARRVKASTILPKIWSWNKSVNFEYKIERNLKET